MLVEDIIELGLCNIASKPDSCLLDKSFESTLVYLELVFFPFHVVFEILIWCCALLSN